MAMQKQKHSSNLKRHKRMPWVRLTIIVIVSIVIIIVGILNIQAATFLSIAALVVGLFQWLLPFEPHKPLHPNALHDGEVQINTVGRTSSTQPGLPPGPFKPSLPTTPLDEEAQTHITEEPPEPGPLPDMVYIPAGPFLMGTTALDIEYFKLHDWDWVRNWYQKELYRWEQPAHEVDLLAFKISRYPVTNLQYKEFIQVTQYVPPTHWIKTMYLPGTDNHPVVYVNWYDAQAYCDWLSQETGKIYRLPTEAEWEKACRGTDGRRWPWGMEWDSKRCNSKAYGVGNSLSVSHFGKNGASPYGIMDCSGNVAEWCSTRWGDLWMSPEYRNPFDATDGREEKQSNDLRITRGGSFRGHIGDVRCTSRSRYPPLKKMDTIGFRCVCEC